MFDVVALGELLIDFTCLSVDEAGYPTLAAHPGGAPSNFLAALAKYGAQTALIGKVGQDAFGQMLRQTLTEAGISTSGLVAAEDTFTTLAFVILDAHGNREFSFARKPGADTRLSTEDVDFSLIDQARVFHFGTLSLTDEPARSATQAAVARAKEHGALITFDPNLRRPLWHSLEEAKEQMLWGLRQADVVKISDEEVQFLFDLAPEAGAEYLQQCLNIPLVFVTCGSDGCIFRNAKAHGHVDSLQGIQVVDTTGAGDIFGGSAVWQLLQIGKEPAALDQADLLRIVRFACTAAGLSTTKHGGISSIPSLADIYAALPNETI